jgi:sigma-E factor negative regulatory protein RseA
MSKESRENLSCLMDGEISRETGRFLVRRLGADRELRETWARYHLVRDCLRPQEVDLTGFGLSQRVRRVLAEETPQSAPGSIVSNWSIPEWLKPVAGMAIAASVALMAIVIVGPGQITADRQEGEFAGNQRAESFVSPNDVLSSNPPSQQVSAMGGSGYSNQKMNSYLLRHYQATGSTGGKGFVTFVPIVVTQAATLADAQAKSQDGTGEDEGTSEKAGQSVQQ